MRQTVTYDKTGDDGRFEATFEPEEFLDAVRDLELPTTADVADAVGCAHRTALHHLNSLEDSDALDSRLVGRAKVWSIAEGVTSASDQRETDPSPTPAEGSEPIGGDETAAEAGEFKDALEAEAWDALDTLDVTGRGHETRQVRKKAIMRAWRELRSRGEAETQEIAIPAFDAYVETPKFGYSASTDRHRAYNFWDGCARDVLKQLPYVEPPEARGNTWRFTGDTESSDVYDPTKEFE